MIRRSTRSSAAEATVEKSSLLQVPLGNNTTSKSNTNEGQRRRKKQKKKRSNSSQRRAKSRFVLFLIGFVSFSLLCGVVIWLVWKRRQTASSSFIMPKMDPRVQVHLAHYHQVRQIALQQSPQETTWPLSYMNQDENRRPPHLLLQNYTHHANAVPCNLTVLFLDPRLASPHYGLGEAAWFALESAATFLPHTATCLALLTSHCAMQTFLVDTQTTTTTTTTTAADMMDVDTAIRDKVYAAALPALRQWMTTGRVRLTTHLNFTKYHLQSCENFGNPTPALIHAHFWQDEFQEQDADAVLILQDDAVLCRSLLLVDGTTWQGRRHGDYAYMGAVWPRVATALLPNPPEGMCWGMPSLWKLLNLRNPAVAAVFDNPCTTQGQAPIGNGGFSLRRRSWMREAIRTCPHVHWSGLEQSVVDASTCRALDDDINEDYYFGTVLRGMASSLDGSVPLLPSARRASLFAVESLFPEQVAEMYGAMEDEKEDEPPPVVIEIDGQAYTVPLGFHKPWWYHSNEILLSTAMQQACPFLPFVFTPEMSRWENQNQKEKT